MILSNQHIKYLRALQLKKNRQKYGQFLVEGEKSVMELFTSSFVVERLYGLRGYVLDEVIQTDVELVYASQTELSRITHLKTAPPLMALVNIPDAKMPKIPDDQWTIVLDRINDPGNLGTIIRIADWFGIQNVVCSTDTVDLYNHKSLMATMGSFGRVEVSYCDIAELLSNSGQAKYFALLDGQDIKSLKKPNPGLIVIGSEAHGISSELMEIEHTAITISGSGGAESLNAGVSAGIICHSLID